jgi:hypothetical protein
VEAQAGVRVEMPPFGDALGRFQVVDYRPIQEVTADGGFRYTQVYTLQAAMSGRQRIPQFRIEFADTRVGEAKKAGTAANAMREHLTDEIVLTVGSVLAGGETELRAAKGVLASIGSGSGGTGILAVIGGAFAVAAAFALFWLWRRRRRRRVREAAHQIALRRLGALEARGWPGASEADDWYVELSAVVRRYLEDRYGVRAPELTTEEFLREASRGHSLSPLHRDLLAEFLLACDRVKFAAYHPQQAESMHSMASARRFVEETRLEPTGTVEAT